MDTFGKRLKYAKDKKGLNNKQLADLMKKKSQSTIIAWENDASEVTLSQLKQLAEILDVTEEFLYKGVDDGTIVNKVPDGYLMVDAVKYSRMLEQLNDKKDAIIEEQNKQLEKVKNR